jgi:hypothetical protein
MYKLEFTLKQHTPLIHFQHNQIGATLRASEVKPKLDKYLDGFSFEYNFEKIKNYLVGFSSSNEDHFKKLYENNYCALDYKMIIKAETLRTPNIVPDGFPCFFGNLGDENKLNPKGFSYTDQAIVINILTHHEFLIKEIKREVPNFFARNNFGTRQSKGFGSFYLCETDPLYEEPVLLSHFNINSNEFTSIFKSIDLVHRALRSGINDIGRNNTHLFYMKPLIWQYFRRKNITWDKKAIKMRFYPTIQADHESDHSYEVDEQEKNKWPLWYDGEGQKMVKDLLGLSLLESWLKPYKISVAKQSRNGILRMKSPIFYKPIRINNGTRIFIDFESIPEDFFNAEFAISNGRKSFNLRTPTSHEFDIEEFFNWALLQTSITNYIAQPYLNTQKSYELQDIFNQLKDNFIK